MTATETMTKNKQTTRNENNYRSNGLKHPTNFSGASSAHTKAILKIKQAEENDHQIKSTFTDNKGNQVKELIPTFRDSDPGELLLELVKELLKFGSRYDLFKKMETSRPNRWTSTKRSHCTLLERHCRNCNESCEGRFHRTTGKIQKSCLESKH